MDQETYSNWRMKNPLNRRAAFMRGTVDPITIMAIPTGREEDRLLEGFVIESSTPSYPVGYASLAWCGENFEFVEGELKFTTLTKKASS